MADILILFSLHEGPWVPACSRLKQDCLVCYSVQSDVGLYRIQCLGLWEDAQGRSGPWKWSRRVTPPVSLLFTVCLVSHTLRHV